MIKGERPSGLKPSLLPPLTKIRITQPFGVNYVNFYKKLGLDGH